MPVTINVTDGHYKTENAIFFVYDDRVLMKLHGIYYKTNTNFMVGAVRVRNLLEDEINVFDSTYRKARQW